MSGVQILATNWVQSANSYDKMVKGGGTKKLAAVRHFF